MKHRLTTTIAAVVMVGCATTQQPEPTTAKAPDISIRDAAMLGNIEAVKQHIAAGTYVDSEVITGWTPLYFAAQGGYKEIVELLLTKGADVNAKTATGTTPLDQASAFNHTQIVELLRKHGGKYGTIYTAVGGGDIEAVKEFLAAGADVNAKDEKGWVPMHLVAIDGNKVIAELLLKSGANVNERTDTGWTPLHLADNKKIAQLLITKGANLNAKNDGGERPLDWAIKRKDVATADLLRKHGGKAGEELKAEGK